PDPKVKAASIIDSLPGNSIVTKTGWITLGTGVTAAALSQELIVLNSEFVILGSFVAFIAYLSTLVRTPYREWADANINKIKDILNSSRAEHTSAVRERIDSVKELQDVEEVTKALFALSEETAKLEHEAYVLRQKSAVAAEIKSVLDSWVRYEGQQREAQQKELVKTVQATVAEQLKDKKLQRDILVSAVAEVEGTFSTLSIVVLVAHWL
ncbi:hypothetical protein BT69DRAFT_1211276, partial [Atractiella rhizophila]